MNIPDAQKKVHSGKKIYVQIIAKDEYNVRFASAIHLPYQLASRLDFLYL